LDLLPKDIEGKFEVLHKISQGGMGAVYKVRHLLLDQISVIKVIRPQHADDESSRQRFLQEARTASRLRHPNVASILDFFTDANGTAYLVMEYIEGVTLKQLLEKGGPPDLALNLEIAHLCLEALAYLHQEGYVHRDVAPDNLMLTKDFKGGPLIKLIDLGIAKNLDGGEGLTTTGMFVGKARYASPEQINGQRDLDSRTDLYSFGVMFYELLTGNTPIEGDNISSLVAGHLFRPPVKFEITDPEDRVPQQLRTIVMWALEKDRNHRPGSARELALALAPIQREASETPRANPAASSTRR